MTVTLQICPICGAKLPDPKSLLEFNCGFCGFERRLPISVQQSLPPLPHKTTNKALELFSQNAVTKIYIDQRQKATFPTDFNRHTFEILSTSDAPAKIDGFWSDRVLPFQEDITGYFKESFNRLNQGGLFFLSTPVKRPFIKECPMPEQINFFKSKNIMFLLEQNGFKMVWRQNRFSPMLRIIARKC